MVSPTASQSSPIGTNTPSSKLVSPNTSFANSAEVPKAPEVSVAFVKGAKRKRLSKVRTLALTL